MINWLIAVLIVTSSSLVLYFLAYFEDKHTELFWKFILFWIILGIIYLVKLEIVDEFLNPPPVIHSGIGYHPHKNM